MDNQEVVPVENSNSAEVVETAIPDSYADYARSAISQETETPKVEDATKVDDSKNDGPKLIDIDGSPDSSKPEDATKVDFSKQNDPKWTFSETVKPETVVATTPDGQPITAAELRDSYFRTQDYTAKTTEFQEQKKAADAIFDWYKTNETYIMGLNSQDETEKVNTLLKLANDLGIKLPSGSQPESQTGLLNLEDFEHDNDLYNLAAQINAERQTRSAVDKKYSELENKFNQFTNSLSEQVQSREVTAELDSIASSYKSSGLSDVDIDGAKKLLGQPMTAQQPMRLANYERIMKHNIKAVSSTKKEVPNEPSATSSHSVDDEVGNLSSVEYLNKMLRNSNNR